MVEPARAAKPPPTALILVDVINSFFLDGMPNYYPAAAEVLEPLSRLQTKARETGKLIVHTVERHYPGFDDYEWRKLPRHHFIGDLGRGLFRWLRAIWATRDRLQQAPL